MMKKFMIFLLVCLLLAGCTQSVPPDSQPTATQPEPTTTQPEPTTAQTEPVTTLPAAPDIQVRFEDFTDWQTEYAVITGLREDGSEAWTRTTDRSPATMIPMLVEVGVWYDRFYYVENNDLVALSLADGRELWRNSELGGVPTKGGFYIDADGTVYVAGYFGPDLFVADAGGNTLRRIAVVDNTYYWPYHIGDAGNGFLFMDLEGTGDATTTARFYIAKEVQPIEADDYAMVKALVKVLYGEDVASCAVSSDCEIPDPEPNSVRHLLTVSIGFHDGTTQEVSLTAYPEHAIFLIP